MSDTYQSIAAIVTATTAHQAIVAEHGSACTINGATMDHASIAELCTSAFLRTYAACGSTPGERNSRRQKKRAIRAEYAASVSADTGFNVKPWMIALAGLAVLILGGIPALLLAIASEIFQQLISTQIAVTALETAATAMGAVNLQDLQSWAWGWFRYDVSLLQEVLKGQRRIMATLDEVLADVTSEKTALDSLVALTSGLKQQLADALSGAVISPEVQAKIDAVFAGVEANKQEVLDALSANTTP